MRFFTILLIALLGIIQFPLWLEYGGLLNVRELRRQLNCKLYNNFKAKLRNEKIMREIKDLENGTVEIEETARYHMRMLKDGEIFIQFEQKNT